APHLFVARLDIDQLFGLTTRQRSQDDIIIERKQSRVHPDTKCKRQHRGESKARRLPHHPHRESQVLYCLVQPTPTPLIARPFLDLLDSAKFALCSITRLIW